MVFYCFFSDKCCFCPVYQLKGKAMFLNIIIWAILFPFSEDGLNKMLCEIFEAKQIWVFIIREDGLNTNAHHSFMIFIEMI